MLITTHTAVGILIGEQTTSLTLAFILGFISHFFLDLIPHGDRHDHEAVKDKKKLKKIIQLSIADTIVAVLFACCYFYFAVKNNMQVGPIIAGLTGSVIPDLFVAIYNLNKKYFFRLNALHLKIHELIKQEIPMSLAILYQFALIVFIAFLYHF